MGTDDTNVRIAREFFAALERADRAAVDALYADDFEIWTPGTLPFSGRSSKAKALGSMGAVLGLFPGGLTFTITGTTSQGERLAVEAESHGRHVSGKTYHNHYHFLFVIRNGKIVRLTEYMDTQHAADVLLAKAPA